MKKTNILFAQFPFGASTHPDVGDWLSRICKQASDDPRVGHMDHMRVDDTPITMGRNRVFKTARQLGTDIVVMVDSDMKPDAYDVNNPFKIAVDVRAKPFWSSTFDFMLAHEGPCMVAAPYCGPPPHENIYVFQWANFASDHPNVDFRLEQFTREEAARWSGILEVGALPTGVCMIDMRALDAIKPPYFEYEYSDPPWNTQKATTEDVFFTRNLSLAGVPVYVNWDAWAGHHKRKCVGKPVLMTVENVREQFRETLVRGDKVNERKTYVREGKRPGVPRFHGEHSEMIARQMQQNYAGPPLKNGEAGPKQFRSAEEAFEAHGVAKKEE